MDKSCNSKGSESDDLMNFSLQEVQKFMKIEIQISKCVKMAYFGLLESPKLISRKIDRF